MDSQDFVNLIGEQFFWNYMTSFIGSGPILRQLYLNFCRTQIIGHDDFQWWAEYFRDNSPRFQDEDGNIDQVAFDAFMANQPVI